MRELNKDDLTLCSLPKYLLLPWQQALAWKGKIEGTLYYSGYERKCQPLEIMER